MMQVNWIYMVIGLCILLAAFAVWLEIRRANKKRLALRMFAVLIAAIALACLALPLSYQKEAKQNDREAFALLTTGFAADSIPANARLFTCDATIKKAYPRAMFVQGLDMLTDTLKDYPLHIYGDGLNKSQLDDLGNLPVIFHPQALPAGVSHISWSQKLKAGRVLQVQGTYQNPSAQKVTLLLKGLNTILDTATIQPKGRRNFELMATPKSNGKRVYQALSVAGGDTVLQGSIPFSVEPVKPLRVLLLSASPGFETKFLKGWLSRQGYAVAARSAISKDKFNSEYINIKQLPLDRLTASTLAQFDVVIGDLSTLNTLGGADAASLRHEVEDSGLGIIMRADSTGKTSWLQKDFLLENIQGKEVFSALNINGKRSSSAKIGNGTTGIRYHEGTQPLIMGAQGRVLASSSIAGQGRLVFSTLGNTYSWALGGNQQDYAAVWSALISKAARRDTSANIPIEVDAMPFAGQPVQLHIANGVSSPISINGEVLAPEQNPAMPFEWSARYWPKEAGWQSLRHDNITDWFYAWPQTEWKGVQAAAKTAATQQYAAGHTPGSIVTKQIHQKLRIEVPKIYFYILLLVACAFLWVERKWL
ncbi:hypothetical protein [Mucilaginibacter psychrotolerans]|uniref:Uncharacterized protein n=1 Tax=Mucilaginibacter psychrotolerans TaxID=1524096 RepID=A0A4Y8SH91_9SPHI|nr:hypothetical protein [Mucilaginibacter psychrotolerans]TFF38000.1 hypothetical protein E2R66_10475 [Mucilaginibacter psychrotolerans]